MLVERFGGRSATQRAIERQTRTALRALQQLTASPLVVLRELARRVV